MVNGATGNDLVLFGVWKRKTLPDLYGMFEYGYSIAKPLRKAIQVEKYFFFS